MRPETQIAESITVIKSRINSDTVILAELDKIIHASENLANAYYYMQRQYNDAVRNKRK